MSIRWVDRSSARRSVTVGLGREGDQCRQIHARPEAMAVRRGAVRGIDARTAQQFARERANDDKAFGERIDFTKRGAP